MNQSFINALYELGRCYEILGDKYRQLYYSHIFVDLTKSFRKELTLDNKDQLISSLGKSATSAFKRSITEFLTHGTLPQISIIKKMSEYAAYFEFKDILGVGPETIHQWVKQKITTRDELRKRVAAGFKISDMQRVGLTYIDNILFKIPRIVVFNTASAIIKSAGSSPSDAVICGSYRRGRSYSGDIDIVFCGHDDQFTNIVKNIKNDSRFLAKISGGKEKFSFYYKALWDDPKSTIRVDIERASLEELAAAIMYFTGSKEFNIKMRGIAKAAGMKLNQHGLFKENKKLNTMTEEDIFKKLKLQYVRPEHRE